MNLVVGSGPVASACAHALLGRGEKVMLVDAGIDLEQAQKGLLNKLSRGPDERALGELAVFDAEQPVTSHGIPVKLLHGSDYPYRGINDLLGMEFHDAAPSASLSVGGLSNVWGAALLPYLQHDIADWPVTADELAPHYEASVAITGISGRVDGLAKKFPLFSAKPSVLNPGSQARAILDGLASIQPTLDREGVVYGASRLAIRAGKVSGMDCVYCGRCLRGCPYGCIYTSADDLPDLVAQKYGPFEYQTNAVIESLRETGAGVVVSGFDRQTKAPVQFEADRAFIAAGVLPSTRIMLKSLGAYDRPVDILDSQYFLIPVLMPAAGKEASREPLHTLSQIFLDIQNEELSRYTVHLQLYTFSDLLADGLRFKMRYLPLLRELMMEQVQHRLIIVQGFLHSVDSGRMKVELKRGENGAVDRFILRGERGAHTVKTVRRVVQRLGKIFRGIGLYPVAPMVELPAPGRGFHYGGSFPMQVRPTGLATDIAGRIPGYSRTHLVDASIFPSIAATTITLTAMANAHRIGSMPAYA